MDNLDKIKFKEAENENWFYKIDIESGNRISFPKKHGYYKEMQAWIEAGNEIEPQFTPEELIQKGIDDQLNEQKSQNSTARQFLNNNDWKIKRHRDQKELVNLGEMESTSITEDEYTTLLIECQEKRDLVVE